jgi:outer membrane receptor protein involved in Fe transport
VTCPVLTYLYAAAELQYESGRMTVYGTSTDPYLLTHLHVSTRSRPEKGKPLTGLFRHTQLSFLINNLLDVTYKTPGGFEHAQPAIIQNGRNFVVRFEYVF